MLNELSVCKWVLANRAKHYKDLILHNLEERDAALANFTHDAYVILLILEKLADEEYLNEYRKLYNCLKTKLAAIQVIQNE